VSGKSQYPKGHILPFLFTLSI